MASQDIVQQLITSVVSNPDLFSNLVEHPYSALRQVTGEENVTKEDASQAVAALSLLGNGKPVDFSSLGELAATLLAQNDNSVHSMASALLSEESNSTPAPADLLSNLAGVTFGQGIAGVDLSDGFGFDDVVGLAGALLSGKL